MIRSGAYVDRLISMMDGGRRISGFHKVLAVPHGLDEEKDGVEAEGRNGEKDFLYCGKVRPRHRRGEARQNQAENRESHDGVKVGIGLGGCNSARDAATRLTGEIARQGR